MVGSSLDSSLSLVLLLLLQLYYTEMGNGSKLYSQTVLGLALTFLLRNIHYSL